VSGTLFLVATPIGNLEDITARALRVLREVDLIAAEDTRVTRKLLAHFDLHTPLTAFHAHSEANKHQALIAKLLAGQSIALVSDAGTPCVSDPGTELVMAAIAQQIRIEPIPGASAVLHALIASGLPTGRFVFEGFLPRTNDRRERLQQIAAEPRTSILYEAPVRLLVTLAELAKACGDDRSVSVGRELTKKFEEHVRGTLLEVIAHFKTTPPRGECVIVLGGNTTPPEEMTAEDTNTLLAAAIARGLSPKDAAREVATATNQSKNALYSHAVEIKRAVEIKSNAD
jgi:16S rRNA (cytidine1402-2'-O)-methyltransferase